MFGWIEIDPEYAIINPDMYKQLDIFFGRSTKKINNKKNKTGSLLYNMLEFDKEMDQDGNIVGPKTVANEPFYGIGMIEFQQRFDEIMDYYYTKKGAKKQDIYDDIMHDKDKLFIHSIPVFTTLLRPTDIVSNTLYYEKINGYYNMIVKLASSVNKNKRKIDRTVRIKNLQLFKLQQKFMVLYDEIIEILNGKKGELRNLVSGRFNFTSRSVIRQNPELRIDQVELPYVELVITQQQRIINILHRMLNISYQEAYDKWFVAIGKVDQTIVNILWDLIKATPEGLPVLINRNPTMEYDVALARNGQRKTN
jgi:DNA-directed RNA polymerase beta' subunit